MRYLQLLLFFALVIVSYRFLGSPLPRVATVSAPAQAPVDTVNTQDTETDPVPTELPNE
ncbi:MAG: hypothetical protein KDD37_00420 [Bdellovibrionales bacterium]|nr:hypothetical protein [Bdellovibrionales bacterium]